MMHKYLTVYVIGCIAAIRTNVCSVDIHQSVQHSPLDICPIVSITE